METDFCGSQLGGGKLGSLQVISEPRVKRTLTKGGGEKRDGVQVVAKEKGSRLRPDTSMEPRPPNKVAVEFKGMRTAPKTHWLPTAMDKRKGTRCEVILSSEGKMEGGVA